MTAKEIQALLATVRKGYVMLNPEWPIFKEMQGAVAKLIREADKATERESQPAAKAVALKSRRKAAKYPPNDPKRPEETAGNYIKRVYSGFRERGGFNADITMMAGAKKINKAAIIESLSVCACGGKAKHHKADELNNLLKCSHCEGCESFHYAAGDRQQPKTTVRKAA